MKFIILFLSLSIRICCSFDVDYANSFQYNRGHSTVLNSIWNIPEVPYISADHQDNWNYLQQQNIYEILFDYSQGCPNTYEPICATNGQQHLYFINSCFLHQRNYQQLLKGQRGMFKEFPSTKRILVTNYILPSLLLL